ncbi:MAG: RHS repeat-associated core domain-containing protein [Candidatus Obscuribacterales bacterium]|nr:RHS repeat-associated core domain-containing protein [Candidatus Obscuribacterales bacterium]
MVLKVEQWICTVAYTWYTRAHKTSSFVRRRCRKSRYEYKSSTTPLRSRKLVSIEIDYPGSNNRTEFTFDGHGSKVKIVEIVSGSITSTKQLLCDEDEIYESRDGSGSVVSQFYSRGQRITGNNYFYSLNHMQSVVELTEASGAIAAQYSYDPYGRSKMIQSGTTSDFQYAGYYFHSRSELYLTSTRAYDAAICCFLSRDIIEENGGLNLYAYTADPVATSDPLGLDAFLMIAWHQVGAQTPKGKIPTAGFHANLLLMCDGKIKGIYDAHPFGPGQPITNNGATLKLTFKSANMTWAQYSKAFPGYFIRQEVINQYSKLSDLSSALSTAAATIAPSKYDFTSHNSNTAIYTLLQRAKIRPPSPIIWAPGWGPL